MKQYIQYFKKYKAAVMLAPLMMVIECISDIVQPMLMSNIVDIGIANQNLNYTVKIGIAMIILAIIAVFSGILNAVFSSKAAVGFATELRKALFKKIQSFSFSNIDKFSTSSLVTRLTGDITQLQNVTTMGLRMFIKAPLLLLFGAIMAISINKELAVILIVSIPILFIGIFVIVKYGFPMFSIMQQKLDKVNESIQENLTNVRVVKSFVRQDYEKKKFAKANTDLMDATMKAMNIVITNMPLMMFVMNFTTIAVVWFGGNQIVAGKFEVGKLMAFINYIFHILMSLMMVSMTLIMFSRAEASSTRIIEVLNTNPDIIDKENTKQIEHIDGKVEFKNVSFKYDSSNEEYILKDINLTINSGETVAIIGSTGSAKTSLVQLIPRLYDVTDGEVLVDGVDVRDYEIKDLREKIGMVLQKNILFSGTIKENLKWGNEEATDEQIIQAAKDAQAHDFIMSFTDKYETDLGQGGVNVSGGQKQRLCIARAILKKPKILILDDSTSAVDTATEAKIREAFNNNLKDTTTIIIAQRISSVISADKIVIIDDGKIIGIGKHDELLANNETYKEIYYSQKEKGVSA